MLAQPGLEDEPHKLLTVPSLKKSPGRQPRTRARSSGKPNSTTLLPPPSGKPGARCAPTRSAGRLPRARRAHAVEPGSLSSGRIGYSSGPARATCAVGPSLKSSPAHNGTPVSRLPEWQRCELLWRPRFAAAVHHRESDVPAINASPSVVALHIAVRLHRRLTPCGRATRTSAGKPGLRRLRLIPPLGSITFGFHRCVTARVPDGFARLKR